MTTLYILALVAVAVGAWLWRGRCEHRKSEQFIMDKQDAIAKARNLLEALRQGKRAQYEDSWRSVEEYFDPKYVSLTEIGTTRRELDQLLALSAARHDARWTAENLHTETDENMFNYYANKMPICLAASGLTAEELDVTNIEELRRAHHIRRASNLASEALGQLRKAHDSVVSMDGLLSKASAGMSEISWVGDKEKMWIQFLREKLAATPTAA